METNKIKVLLIEDSVDDAALIKRKLEKSVSTKYQIAVAQKLDDGLKQAGKNPPDLILSDLGLPDSHGMDTVTKILLALPHIPLVVLSGFDDETTAIRAVQSGAQDYLVKGQLDNPKWEQTLLYSLERARLHEELEKNTQEISKLHNNLLRILENNADAIMVVNEEKRILFANHAVESLFGRKPRELLKMPFQYPLDVGKTFEIVIHRADENTTIAETTVVNISWESQPAYLVSMHNITKRKAMEEALQTSEVKYRTIFEMAQDGIVSINLQGYITSCNEAFARMGGVPKEDIIGKHFTETAFAIPKESASYAKFFSTLLSNGKLSPLEIAWPRTDGTTRIVEVRASLMKQNDKIIGAQAMTLDITERKAMEKALRDSEDSLKMYLENAPDGVYISDLKGSFIYGNKKAEVITGYKREELISKNFLELNLLPRKYLAKAIKLLALNMIGKPTGPDEFELRRQNGNHVWVEIKTAPIWQKGEVRVIGFVRDITDRKQMENALVDEATRRRILIEQSSDGIVILDNDGKVYEANQRFANMLGYTMDEVKQLHVFDWAFQHPREQVVEMIRTVDEKGDHFETQHRRKDGTTYDVEISSNGAMFAGQKLIFCVCRDITRRKAIEKALIDSEEKFSKAFMNSPQAIVITDLEKGIIIEANDTFLQLTGYKRQDLIGKKAIDLKLWNSPQEREYIIQNLKEKGVVKNFERQFHTKSGEMHTWLFSAETVTIDNKPCMLSVTVDITERKNMEYALREREKRFSDIAENTLEWIWEVDVNGKYTYSSPVVEKILGYKPEEILEKHFYSFFLPEEREELKKAALEVFAQKQPFSEFINRNIHKNGKTVDLLTSGVPIIDKEGNFLGYRGVDTDITERKKTEEALKQSEEKYRELINTSTDAIISVDSRMNIAIWNQGAERIFGYTEKEMLGQSIMTIFPTTLHKDIAREIVNFKNNITSKFTNRIFETSGLKKDCSTVPIEVSISTRKAEGNVIITMIIRDITIRKQAEEKLRKVDQMKSEFLSNVSHELRTPLQSISGFTKLILTNKVPDPAIQQEFLQIVDRETVHLGNLINSLLDMSRLESGRFQIYKKIASLSDIFTDSRKMFHSLAREKDITFNEIIPAKLPKIEVDIERMRQVIINLLSNAIKFSDPGSSINIKVSVHENELLFQVTDHGIGIRDETMVHLFERFYRVEGETVRGGTGLGLYISKQIIDAHGGRIWAESKFGEGSTFSFALPLKEEGGKKDVKKDTGNRRRPSHPKARRVLSKARGIPDNHRVQRA